MIAPNRFFFVDDIEPAEFCPLNTEMRMGWGFWDLPSQWAVVIHVGDPYVFEVHVGGWYFQPAVDELLRRLNAEYSPDTRT